MKPGRMLGSGMAVWLVAAAATQAAPGQPAHPSGSDGPAATADAFHRALAGGDREAVLALLAEDAVIFESGGAEMSPTEYAHHHLEADMEFAKATQRGVVDRLAREVGHIAWILTRSETRGSFRGRDIALRGTETVVLEHGEGGWRIAHIHWSSRPLGEE